MRSSSGFGATTSWAARLRPWCGVALTALAIASVGCADRSHLTSSHGRAYSEAFERQTVNADSSAADPKRIQGLDSQEASAVARNYRRGLNSKEGGGDPNAQNLIMTGGGAAQGQPYMPPPSVPNGQ
jgi:hypothetical protein